MKINAIAHADFRLGMAPDYELRNTRCIYELCKNLPEPEQRTGRPRLALADIIFSSTYKVYSTMSGRRFSTDLREAKARGYLSRLPHYNSVFRYLESEALTPYLYELITVSAQPLIPVESKFAVDSSEFSTGQFMRWFDVKYGKEEDRRMAQTASDVRNYNQHRDSRASE